MFGSIENFLFIYEKSFCDENTNYYSFRYDYPDPGSEIDYMADDRVDYVRRYDGVSIAQFRKKIKNQKPFVSQYRFGQFFRRKFLTLNTIQKISKICIIIQ